MEQITKEQIAQDLSVLGLERGDVVYVHSSMKRIGWMEAGASTLLDAFLDVLGPEGTLAVPTHTYSFQKDQPYDPLSTPTELGKFPDTLWRDPRALRSGNGSHSSAAIGAKAAALTVNHDPTHALGLESPLRRLYEMDGLILLLGVTFTTCTALHLAESMSGVPYTKLHYDASWGTEVYIVQEKEVLAYTQQEFPGCSNGFDRIIPHLPPEILRRGKVGGAQCFLVRAKPLLDTTIALLRHQADFFLCDSPDCPCCPDRWALLKSQ